MKQSLVIFAKPPFAGKAKMRLAKSLGARRIAWLYESMLQATVHLGLSVDCARKVIAVATEDGITYFRNLRRRTPFSIVRQGSGDLGERMTRVSLKRFLLATTKLC